MKTSLGKRLCWLAMILGTVVLTTLAIWIVVRDVLV